MKIVTNRIRFEPNLRVVEISIWNHVDEYIEGPMWFIEELKWILRRRI